MRGAIAAGHPLTVDAGARILAEGGNAVDAAVGAAFVAWVAESPLTGPGAGGFMLVHRAADASERVLDFFAGVPGRDLEHEAAPMESVDVRFDDRTTQMFLIGPASCAVPGMAAGLAEAHRLYGSLPWGELVAPAIALAREGVVLTRRQAYLHAILDPILRRDGGGRAIYGRNAPIAAGGRLRMADLANTLERISLDGADVLYRGELAEEIARHVVSGGGRVTSQDLAEYRVIRRRPVRARFRRTEFVSNPPPSLGGVLIAFALRFLDQQPRRRQGSAAAIMQLGAAMEATAAARSGSLPTRSPRGPLSRRLLDDECVRAAIAGFGTLPRPVREARRLPSTTHVSVVDGSGNAASLSSSTGSGSGVVVPGTGIHLNNMLGEPDLNRQRGAGRPATRLTSMMAPSLVLDGGRPRLVVGSAGSERLRAAILQVVVNVVEHGLSVREAIEASRVYLDGTTFHLEGGTTREVASQLEGSGYRLVRWRSRNLFFGGVAAVGVRDGRLEAAGDPRRGGSGRVVS
jgi:gamma-glutamyltranspeptidase / glutathione hydrolase